MYELGFYMGCGGSKADELPLVALSRQRKELIRAAADHRYALASAHIAYFASLRDVGDALRRFVDEEIVIASTSSPDSPVLTLPSDEGKNSKKKGNAKSLSSTSTSLSHSGSISHTNDHHYNHDHDHDGDDFHLRNLSDSDSGPESGPIHGSPEHQRRTYSPPNQTGWGSYGMNPEPNWGSYGYNPPSQPAWGSYESSFPPQTAWNSYDSIPPPQNNWGSYEFNQPPQTNWGPFGSNQPSYNTYAYYMKKSAPVMRTVIHPEEQRMHFGGGQWGEQPNSYSNSGFQNENGGYFGMNSPPAVERRPPPAAAPPPPSPQVSAWDFFNPFDAYDNGYPGYYSQNKNQSSGVSSPDSTEVRLREGIPPLEDETETETDREFHKGKSSNDREVHKGKNLNQEDRRHNTHKKSVPLHKNESNSSEIPPDPIQNSDDNPESSEREHFEDVDGEDKEGKGSTGSTMSSTSIEHEDEDYVKKKGVHFEVEEMSNHEVDSSRLSSLTTLSVHGTRDLQEAVTEIRDEFAIASSYGKEVAVMLEVGKLPYKPKLTLQVIISRILYLISPSLSPMEPPLHSVRLNSRTVKLAKSYFEDNGQGPNLKPINLSSTLERLYAWEKKLHKEIKDEEKLRVNYEKMCRYLKILDERGADHTKIEATQASIRNLVTKLDVSINAIDSISTRIHNLRDKELEPQVTELIHGLIRMWQSILKCHQKQFQAIKESKLQKLKANTALRTDSSLTATKALETELLAWSTHFNDWVTAQKSYVKSLSEWLNHFLNREPIQTSDGPAPFSPGRIGAPPIFVICNDWADAMGAVHEAGVKRAMQSFASDVHRLYERQDDELRQRVRAEHKYKDYESNVSKVKGKKKTARAKTARADGSGSGSLKASDNGVSPLDDLKVDLDLMRKKYEEERARHKATVKLVHDAASGSLQGGLVPIFKSLETFTAEALRAHEQVRIEIGRGEVS